MFFAINQGAMEENQAISLMPILFYAPWAIFCTLSGYFADRYSKRNSLVAWKFAEILITGIAVVGFWLGTHGERSGAWIVLSTVFLMGMHSAFFVPAKYGAMPEILTSRQLSRGNGVLESLSFLAVILGTVCGGVMSQQFRGEEHRIGFILFGLAVIGAVASLLIRKMPAANPDRPFPPYLYKPLWENTRVLLKSRPLAFAVLGIAFFTFLVAFMRSTVYMHGNSQVPRWTESKTSEIVGMVALGIGLGSPLVGFLSGGKVELGLVPLGAVGMIVGAVVAAVFLQSLPVLIGCIIVLGFFTGFYIVPLFTLLQHRAPKTSKGDSIATSNFINVTGAMLASLVFFGMDWSARRTGLAPQLEQRDLLSGQLARPVEYREGRPRRVVVTTETGEETFESNPTVQIDTIRDPVSVGSDVMVSTFVRGEGKHFVVRLADKPQRPKFDKREMPRLLFLSAGAMTLATLLLLWWQMPDLMRRTRLWFRWLRRCRLQPVGLHHLPMDGPVVLVTNAADGDGCAQVVCATDRLTRIVSGSEAALAALARGEVVLIPAGDVQGAAQEARESAAPVIPVWVESVPGDGRPTVYVVFGMAVADRTAAGIEEALGKTSVGFSREGSARPVH
jgi:MFS family permease